jgi:hypothetical protein
LVGSSNLSPGTTRPLTTASGQKVAVAVEDDGQLYTLDRKPLGIYLQTVNGGVRVADAGALARFKSVVAI